MDSRTRNVFVGLFVLLIGVAAGAAVLLAQAPAGPPAGTQSVEGVIVSVDSSGLTDVMGFDLRTSDGDTLTFSLQYLENGATFPPGHLVEHQASASPVRVWYRSVGAVFFAIALEDAVHPADQGAAVISSRTASSSASEMAISYDPRTTPSRSTA